jgi:hypothetical protein
MYLYKLFDDLVLSRGSKEPAPAKNEAMPEKVRVSSE